MGKSLNAYASRVAHIVGQPDNQSLKERVKDMIKEYFAKYIIQSIDRNGINPYYKLTLIIDMIPVESSKKKLLTGQEYYTEFISKTKVPTPMNIKNDAPFTRVSIPESSKLFAYMGTTSAYRISFNLLPTGFSKVYAYSNNNVIIKRNVNANLITNSIDVWDDENDTLRYRKLELEGLWENPEDVIGYYGITDNQDLELPFPEEMLGFIIAEILKTEFAIAPKDIEIDKK